MPRLWLPQRGEADWSVLALDDHDCLYLTGEPDRPVSAEARERGDWPASVVRQRGGGPKEQWLLLARPGAAVAVNAVPVLAGLRVLADRDEVRVGACVLYFSAERPACVTEFPGIGKPCKCPRCQLEIVPAAPAVQCPTCGVWHHQSEESPCWTYAEHCAAFCGQSTALDGEPAWVPEGL